jgi:hypothetical protein
MLYFVFLCVSMAGRPDNCDVMGENGSYATIEACQQRIEYLRRTTPDIEGVGQVPGDPPSRFEFRCIAP